MTERGEFSTGPRGDELEGMFSGNPAEVAQGMRAHFVWLAENAAQVHNPATEWGPFVERLWRSTARWAGWIRDERDWEGVEPPWFATEDDPKVVTWYQPGDEDPPSAGNQSRSRPAES